MKINNLNNGNLSSISRADQGRVQPAGKVARAAPVSGEDRVTISDEARFLAELRDAAGGMDNIRPEVVEAARADMEAGRIGTEEDYKRAIEALLMEL